MQQLQVVDMKEFTSIAFVHEPLKPCINSAKAQGYVEWKATNLFLLIALCKVRSSQVWLERIPTRVQATERAERARGEGGRFPRSGRLSAFVTCHFPAAAAYDHRRGNNRILGVQVVH